jgi:endo-alpha-1,4-polygalactosaminidase (GH114 family)
MRKSLIIVSVIITLIGFISYYIQNKNPLNHIDNYRVFYGRPEKDYKNSFKAYDLLILEPFFYDKEDLKELKADNKQLYFGYLSVMEVSHWDEDLLKQMDLKDYLEINGKRYKKDGSVNFIGDLRNESYRELLMTLIEKRVVDKGFQGVFLDTVDWIDYFGYSDKVLRESFKKSYVIFLKEVKKKYPDLLIIQNRSFDTYESFAKSYVHGIMWENFDYKKMFNEDLSRTIDLMKNKWVYGNQVLTISHQEYEKNLLWSKRFSWVFMPSYNSYSRWPGSKE